MHRLLSSFELNEIANFNNVETYNRVVNFFRKSIYKHTIQNKTMYNAMNTQNTKKCYEVK